MQTKPSNLQRKKVKPQKILLIISITLAALFLASLVAIPFMVMPTFLGQRYEQQQYNSADYGIVSQPITLTTQDSLSIAAWRTRAADPKGTIIILSGIQNPSVTAFFGYAKLFGDNGWDCLLIEMRARSQSEGDEIGLGMTEWLDVKAGVDYLMADDERKDLPIVAMGTSMGASTVIIAAGEIPEIDAVISLSAFSSWPSVFAENMAMMGMPHAIGTLDQPFMNLYLGLHFGFDSLQYTPLNGIPKLAQRPLLLMHSTEDSQVPYSEFEKLLSKADKNNSNITTFTREGDEHFICYEAYFDNPIGDAEFSDAILNFLTTNFPG